MLHKLLPILLLAFAGCTDAPSNDQIVSASTADKEVDANGAQTADKLTVRPGRLASMFRSDDNGRSWTPISDGLPENLAVSHMDTLGRQIVLGSNNFGVFLSDPERQSWQQLDTTSLPSNGITSLYVDRGNIYAGVYKNGIYVSNNVGKSWVSLNHNLGGERVKSILRTGKELWIGTDSGIYALPDGGEVWRQISNKPQMRGLLKVGDNFVAGTYEGIAVSSDNGKTWNVVNRKIKPSELSVVDGKIIAMDTEKGLEFSDDMGKTWNPIQDGVVHDIAVLEVVKTGNNLLRTQWDGIYLSQDWGKTWKDIYHFSYGEPFGVMLSTGKQWNEVYSRPEVPFLQLMVLDGVVYGATGRGC
ncbi:MAG: hypothetical protein K9J37_19430 [Saprospiraceae bacterium]|nr:hypothetical protein [Saprospiraceae bacterium]MCF8252098.1 hypothetical protein [Saprospiraceae bacterium]MCF8282455.1 hypothetical protein [Bacteroidales bacterium]MCF8313741.1 hypothetical protein [Saprospiraceae bacterium]MCF8442451.1 hypothetical protein [Saprospiraceae bacterium]